MSNNKTEPKNKQLQEEIHELNEQLHIQRTQREKINLELQQYEQKFAYAERKVNFIAKGIRRILRMARSIAAYILGRRNIKHLYSRSFKTKNASNQLKTNKYFLYNLGFIDRSLQDLKQNLHHTHDQYIKRAINWELGLWYANELTVDGARQALTYIQAAMTGEKEADRLRKGTILQAECYERLSAYETGKQLIQKRLKTDRHPDLYLAMANLEKPIDERLKWINKALDMYDIHHITFQENTEKVTYNDLQTMPIARNVSSGPKVSVLLPAYHAEQGIQIAIESILSQTWENIELLIIDDCSTDKTVDVIKRYMEEDERIKLFSTRENSGPYVARNIGLQHATGDFITVNDADDWSHAEKIEIQVNHLLENPDIIANTSEHARLTEDLKLYRRGTPGTYIFSNMSSLMFRREPVTEKLGYWDSVRFAADGEFKRRLIKTFGASRIVDLQTGPLSLPRQSPSSLTGSSAFGYSGYFMGARKEYVASFTNYHDKAASLYYPYSNEQRLFPVPEPMWPRREEKYLGIRHFDIVIAADFQIANEIQLSTIQEINVHKKLGIRTGIVQMSCYNMTRPKELPNEIRKLVDGHDTQVLVYGEEISCEVLIIKSHTILNEKQLYLPNLKPKMVVVVIDDAPYDFRQCGRQLVEYFEKRGIWYAYNDQIYEQLQTNYERQLRYIHLSIEPWMNNHKTYESRLEDWLTN